MNPRIAILITTFLRDNLLYKTLQSIVDNYTENCIVLIADQGYKSDEKATTIEYIKSQIPCEYFRLPFDCGLSAARNFLVQNARALNIPYCLVSADSIQFSQQYNFLPIIDFLESDAQHGIVGFELEGSKCPWEYLIHVDSQGIHLIPYTQTIQFNEHIFKKIDICRNIFLAKTDVLVKNRWDDELKLAEHELFFITLKQINYNVFFTDTLKFKKNNSGNTKEYSEYRKRLNYYLLILKEKLHIKNWVIYEK